MDTRHQVPENTGGDTAVVATVEATDYNHDELTYTLGGTDGESFHILDENIGELRVRSTTQLDYETRRDIRSHRHRHRRAEHQRHGHVDHRSHRR